MIIKVGDSLGETFGNFVGRQAATPEVLTPVIPAFCAGVLIVHPILPYLTTPQCCQWSEMATGLARIYRWTRMDGVRTVEVG